MIMEERKTLTTFEGAKFINTLHEVGHDLTSKLDYNFAFKVST